MSKIKTEIEKYYNNVIGFFSGYICALCTPMARNFFEFKNGNFIIRLSRSTCRGIYKWYRFSSSMSTIFNTTIFPIMEFFKCIKNKMEDPNYALFLVNENFLKKHKDVSICYEDSGIHDESCQKMCSVSLGNFSIKHSFVRNYKQALKSNPIFYINFQLQQKQSLILMLRITIWIKKEKQSILKTGNTWCILFLIFPGFWQQNSIWKIPNIFYKIIQKSLVLILILNKVHLCTFENLLKLI